MNNVNNNKNKYLLYNFFKKLLKIGFIILRICIVFFYSKYTYKFIMNLIKKISKKKNYSVINFTNTLSLIFFLIIIFDNFSIVKTFIKNSWKNCKDKRKIII